MKKDDIVMHDGLSALVKEVAEDGSVVVEFLYSHSKTGAPTGRYFLPNKKVAGGDVTKADDAIVSAVRQAMGEQDRPKEPPKAKPKAKEVATSIATPDVLLPTSVDLK